VNKLFYFCGQKHCDVTSKQVVLFFAIMFVVTLCASLAVIRLSGCGTNICSTNCHKSSLNSGRDWLRILAGNFSKLKQEQKNEQSTNKETN
jgi:hypothetical protein